MDDERPGLRWKPVALADVIIDDAFWSPRLRITREQTIPYQYKQCRDTGRIAALTLNWRPGDEPVPHIFWESDVAKWIEAASYSLVTHPDRALAALLDDVIALLASAQQSDGYLNVYFTVVKPGLRWTDLRDAHELYCAGHLMEAGAAHFQATGKRTLLDVVCRYADHIGTVFGTAPGQKRGYCGHEEIELALVKLYRVTGEERYLRLSQYFVDERGREPSYFAHEAEVRGRPSYFEEHFRRHRLRDLREYNQSHRPVRDQDEVVGHAVRAMYLYSAMADLAGETGDASLLRACERLWNHVCTRRMYITGGLGSSAHNEGFTTDYDLPNETAYAETCAAIGLVFWSHRMAQLDCHGRYTDVLERALYNGVISGMAADGTRFFYANPLASVGDAHRQEWFDVACCPPNLARLLASLGQYIYSAGERELAVHLYVQGSARVTLGGRSVQIRQETTYPWDGTITITVDVDQPTPFGLRLRRPAWARDAAVWVNDAPIDFAGSMVNGYIRIERVWQAGDRVRLTLSMPVERVYAHPAVRQDVGDVALQRGPLVYCLEEVDNGASLQQVAVPRGAALEARYDEHTLGGLVTLTGTALVARAGSDGGELYDHAAPALSPLPITAIPYYAWDNRQPGQMRVWLHEVVDCNAGGG